MEAVHLSKPHIMSEIKKCGASRDLLRGRELHSQAMNSNLTSDLYLVNTIISMYSKCGSMADAQSVFNNMVHRDIVSWNCLIQGYATNGKCEIALELFDQVKNRLKPDDRTYTAALSACASLVSKQDGELQKWLDKARDIHESSGYHTVYMQSILISIYAMCRRMKEAQEIFENMRNPDVVTWTALLQGYVENGENERAVEIFRDMKRIVKPDTRAYCMAITACANKRWIEKGKAIYTEAVERRCTDTFMENVVMNMYCKCGIMVEAKRVFKRMVKPDVVSWNTLIQGYVENGQSELALEAFEGMKSVEPDARTYLSALTACLGLARKKSSRLLMVRTKDERDLDTRCISKGKDIYVRAVRNKCENRVFLDNVMISVYSSCGEMGEARKVFDGMSTRDVVSWNSLMQGYVENEESELALETFEDMKECAPDSRTYLIAITACGALCEAGSTWLENGEALYQQAVRNKCCNYMHDTALLDMYVKCKKMVRAREVFESMSQRDVAAWNCLIQGYVENGEDEMALDSFSRMDIGPNSLTLVVSLKACGNVLSVEKGKMLHYEIYVRGFEKDTVVTSCLVEFYGKCGRLGDAKLVFDSVTVEDTWSWNSLIYGYSQQGNLVQAYGTFVCMTEQGVTPNGVTFVHVLFACSHGGATERGKECFDEMQGKYGIIPDIEHYNCVIDMLGRGNYLDEAMKIVENMHIKPDAVTWKTILAACQKWNNPVIGGLAYESLLKMGEQDDSTYVLMGNAIAN